MIAPFPPGGGVIYIETKPSQFYNIDGGDVVFQETFQYVVIHIKNPYDRVSAMPEPAQFAVMMFVSASGTTKNLVAASVFYPAAALQT